MGPLRLHTKTTLLVSAITLAMFVATLLLISVRMVNLVREDEKELARLQAISLAEQISLGSTTDQEILDRAVSQARGARPNVIAVRVWKQTANGLIVGASAKEMTEDRSGLPKEIRDDAAAAMKRSSRFRRTIAFRDFTIENGRETQYRVFAPITDQGRFYGVVEVSERLGNVPSIVKRFAQTASLLAFVAIALTMLAIYLLFRYFVYRPMNLVLDAMARVKAGTLDVDVPISTRDEVGRLARGFNRMIERIRELTGKLESQQQTLRERVREATSELQAEIVERKRAEAESNAAAERYRLIFDSNPLPMWVYDPETLAFLNVNQAAVRSYGWSREEFRALAIRDIYASEDIPRLLEQIALTEGERSQALQWRHQRKDGSLIDVEVLSHDLIFEGRKARLMIASDVTDKKRVEAALLRSQRLESLGTLAGGIAHDLNNILSPLSVSTFLLRPQVTEERGQKTLDTMDEVIERGSLLVRQVLSFARGAEGARVPLDPRKVVDEVVDILKETFPRSIRIRSSVKDLSATVLADPTQLHQVIMNLCVNARDAMPDGGELEITAGLAELDEHYTQLTEGRGKFMVVAVRDTGTGIDPQVIDKIFDPFFTTKEQGKGTGLGLSTSLGIVRSHGGFISVYSEPGNGTLFNVYLPLMEAEDASTTHDAPSAPPPGNGELIMLVDDEEPIRRTTRGMLEASNYRVITASDGLEACSLYRERSRDISLVLTDMMMPVMDGAAMIRELKSCDPKLPIIATSGLAEAGREEQARSVGALKFMSKPYTASSLLWAVHELLNKGTNGTDHKES